MERSEMTGELTFKDTTPTINRYEVFVYPNLKRITVRTAIDNDVNFDFNTEEEMLDFPQAIIRRFNEEYLNRKVSELSHVWEVQWDYFEFYEGYQGRLLVRLKESAIDFARNKIREVLIIGREEGFEKDEYTIRTLKKVEEKYVGDSVEFYATVLKEEFKGDTCVSTEERERFCCHISKVQILDKLGRSTAKAYVGKRAENAPIRFISREDLEGSPQESGETGSKTEATME